MSSSFRFANGKAMTIDAPHVGDDFSNWASFIEFHTPLSAGPRAPIRSIGLNVEGNHGLEIKKLEYDLVDDEELRLRGQVLRVYESRTRDFKVGAIVGSNFNANGFFGKELATEEIVDGFASVDFEETPEGAVVTSDTLDVRRCLGSLQVDGRGYLHFDESPSASKLVPEWAGVPVEVGEVWDATPPDQDHVSHSHYLMATPDFVAVSYPFPDDSLPDDVRSGAAIGEVFTLLTKLDAG